MGEAFDETTEEVVYSDVTKYYLYRCFAISAHLQCSTSQVSRIALQYLSSLGLCWEKGHLAPISEQKQLWPVILPAKHEYLVSEPNTTKTI